MHFDASVNHGLGAAAKMLQEAAGVAIDGEIGPDHTRRLHATSLGNPAAALR